MANFLNSDQRLAELVAGAVRKGLAVGVGDDSVRAIRKAQSKRLRLDDSLLKRDFVEQISFDATVATIRKLHETGGRAESGDTMLTLRKIDARTPALVERLPGQSDNGQDIEADPTRAGARTGISMYQNGPSDHAKPSLFGAKPHAASVSRPSRSLIEAPLAAEPTEDTVDAIKRDLDPARAKSLLS